jgi:hypothetical protein
VSLEGWVVSNNAVGNDAWNDGNDSSAGGLGFFSQSASRQQQQPQHAAENTVTPSDSRLGRVSTNPTVSSGIAIGPSFPSGGRQLGTASRRQNTDPRQARLQAIERRSGAASNDEQV